jgi:methylated-DNA-protein-cysteine methyltransferase-like protein
MDNNRVSEVSRRIAAALMDIPPGEVSTYSEVARAAGLANGARQVVRFLHSSAKSEGLPWHRIVRKDGNIALPVGGGFELQKALLKSEGVEVDASGRVDLSQFGHQF